MHEKIVIDADSALESPELVLRLTALKEHLQLKTIDELYGKMAVPISITKFKKFMSNHLIADFNIKERIALTQFVYDMNFITDVSSTVKTVENIKNNMYFSLLSFLGFSPETEKDTKATVPGLYILYRPSLKIPNMFTVGSLNISIDPISKALRVEEIHKFKDSDSFHSGSVSTERGIDERFNGYMVRKRRRYISFQRNKSLKNSNLIITIYNDEFLTGDEKPKIASLGGICFGTSGSRMYVSRVFVERYDGYLNYEQVIDQLSYVEAKHIKPSVLKNLELSPGVYFHVF